MMRKTTSLRGDNQTNRHGFMLIAAYSVLGMLMIASATTMQRSLGELRVNTHHNDMNRSFWLAESGVAEAIKNVEDGLYINVPETQLSDGSYAATLTALGGNEYRIQGIGTSHEAGRQIEVVVARNARSFFQYALFGDQRLVVQGSVITDGFDSANGPYDEDTAFENGNIGTNSTAVGSIAISGSVDIYGQLAVGEGATTPEAAVTTTGGAYTISADPAMVSLQEDLPLTSVIIPAHLTCTDLSVSDQEVHTLAAGEYCFNDLSVLGSGTLTSTGPVDIYINHNFYAGGNTVVGNAANPDWLIMQIASAGENVLGATMIGNMSFYGGLYAPQAEIEIGGNANVYGSVIAEEIDVTGHAAIHYNAALGRTDRPLWGYLANVVSWREVR